MDTPQKNPSSLLSKFQDSPVFNYLSTLSPIRPFNLGHSGQSFHLLSFTSPQSSLPSPLANCPREPKVTRAILLHDEPKNNCLQDVIELPKSVKYDSSESNVGGTEKSSGEVIQDISEEAENSFENEMDKQQISMEKNKEVCEWEKFISEASDLLNCGSPTDKNDHKELDEKSPDSGTLSSVATILQPTNDCIDDMKRTVENHDMEIRLTKLGVRGANEASLGPPVKSCAVLAEEVVHSSSAEQDDKQQKMTRSRCLVYEMSGTHYRKLLGSSPNSKPSVSPNTSKEKRLVPSKSGTNKFSSLLPGIGLHLNALAGSSKDKLIVKRQTVKCRRQLLSSPCPISSIDSPNSNTKPLNAPKPQDLGNAGSDSNERKDEVQANENACQSSMIGDGSEFPQSSPKKKRQKSENGDSDSCKRCSCKRSKCLKLYCECFAAGLYCAKSCNCQDCFNNPVHKDAVLETRRQIVSRNPLAFAPKVIKCSNTLKNADELKKTPASARHKRGCNCKKSGCLKKYCECFQSGVGCSLSCRCEGCKNTFGQKEGTEGLAIYGEAQMLEKSTNISSNLDVSKTDVDREDEAPLEPSKQQDGVTRKPVKQARRPFRRPFLFNDMTSPRLPSLPNAPSLQPCKTRETGNPDLKEDETETPLVLKGDNYLLPTSVNSTSPICKRVSPLHYQDFETSPSPGWSSCRKLILRSIPSFLTFNSEKQMREIQQKLQSKDNIIE